MSTISGRCARGTSISAHNSSSPSRPSCAINWVRLALLASVRCAPPVNFQISQLSLEPNAGASSTKGAPGSLSKIQRTVVAGDTGSETGQVRCWHKDRQGVGKGKSGDVSGESGEDR